MKQMLRKNVLVAATTIFIGATSASGHSFWVNSFT